MGCRSQGSRGDDGPPDYRVLLGYFSGREGASTSACCSACSLSLSHPSLSPSSSSSSSLPPCLCLPPSRPPLARARRLGWVWVWTWEAPPGLEIRQISSPLVTHGPALAPVQTGPDVPLSEDGLGRAGTRIEEPRRETDGQGALSSAIGPDDCSGVQPSRPQALFETQPLCHGSGTGRGTTGT